MKKAIALFLMLNFVLVLMPFAYADTSCPYKLSNLSTGYGHGGFSWGSSSNSASVPTPIPTSPPTPTPTPEPTPVPTPRPTPTPVTKAYDLSYVRNSDDFAWYQSAGFILS